MSWENLLHMIPQYKTELFKLNEMNNFASWEKLRPSMKGSSWLILQTGEGVSINEYYEIFLWGNFSELYLWQIINGYSKIWLGLKQWR